MKPAVHIQHPQAKTHLPTHELAARRRRSAASLPVLPKPARPAKPRHRGRRTVGTRFFNL